MGIWDENRTPERQQQVLQGMENEKEIVTKEAELLEMKSIVKELKENYGPKWKVILGVKNVTLDTLRTVMRSGGGLKRQAEQHTAPFRKSPSPANPLKGTYDLSHFRQGW